MKRERQTANPILRAWGNLCSYLGSWFFGQADRYGDVFVMDEEFLSLISNDSTGVWDPDND